MIARNERLNRTAGRTGCGQSGPGIPACGPHRELEANADLAGALPGDRRAPFGLIAPVAILQPDSFFVPGGSLWLRRAADTRNRHPPPINQLRSAPPGRGLRDP